MEQKQHSSLLDYDDLLLYWHAMMCEPRLAQHIGAHFDHVLVDEYQDTNRLQAEILHALKPDGAGLAVVGDDAQAIYSFRAAAVENILGFPERFQPPAEVVTLAQNYRSTQPVLDVANAVMAEAPRQHRKYLLSVRGDGARPRAVTVDELQTQAEYVCTEVLKRREASVPLKRQAVLFRTASHSDMLEVELTKRKIPFVKYGGLKFLEAAHIKDLLGGAALGGQSAQCRWPPSARCSCCRAWGRSMRAPRIDHFEAGGHSFESLKSFKPPQTGEMRLASASSSCMQALADPQRPWPGQVHLAREWYRPHFERLYEQFHTRLGDLEQLELLSGAVPLARALPHRAHARSAAMPPATCRAARRSMRTTWCCRPSTRPRAWSGTRCSCSTSSTAASRTSSPPASPS